MSSDIPFAIHWGDLSFKTLPHDLRGDRKRLDFCTVTSHVEVTGRVEVMECWLKHTKVLKRLASVLATALTLGQEIKLDDGFYAYDETKFGTAAQISVTGPTVGFLEVPKTESELALWDPTDGTGYHRLTQG